MTSGPLRFAPPAEHPQAALLTRPPRPNGISDEEWGTLRVVLTRRDRKLFAALMFHAISAFCLGARVRFPGRTQTDEWLAGFARSTSWSEAVTSAADATPRQLRHQADMLGLVACASPRLIALGLDEPDEFKAMARDARNDLAQAQADIDAALSLIDPSRGVPDHVPTDWSQP